MTRNIENELIKNRDISWYSNKKLSEETPKTPKYLSDISPNVESTCEDLLESQNSDHYGLIDLAFSSVINC